MRKIMMIFTIASLQHVRRNEMKYLAFLLAHLNTILLVFIIGLLLAPPLAPPVMIDVKIYASGDPEAYIYCATGSLVPPARFVANGSVPEGQESYC